MSCDRLPRSPVLASLVVAGLLIAPAAHAAYLTGSVAGGGGIKLQTNPKTRHVRIEARYLRLVCSDGVDTGGISPEPVRTRYSKHGRFHATASGPGGGFFYVAGRIRGDRAQGTLFWWISAAPTRPVPCVTRSDDGPGAVPWSASVPR